MTDPIDIVERLEYAANDSSGHWQMLDEAAAEITRLRAELAETQKLARDDFDLRAEQRDERDRLRAALAAQVPQWLPIESAPKDGTAVLATWAHTWTEVGPHIEACETGEEGGWYYSYDGDAPPTAPTHWMPLPVAPGASPPAAPTGHRQGCDALGGYGHGIGPCTCGASPQPAAVPDGFLWRSRRQVAEWHKAFPGEEPDGLWRYEHGTKNLVDCERDDAIEVVRLHRATSPQPAAVPGWQWVPVEPTPAMLYPDLQTAGPDTQLGNICADFGRQIWARMLAASPQPPQQGREGLPNAQAHRPDPAR